MKYVLIKTDSKEWDEIWEWLKNHPINKDIDNPTLALNENEVWQYMGTYLHDNNAVSNFRHRIHPITNNIQCISYKHFLNEKSIDKEFKI